MDMVEAYEHLARTMPTYRHAQRSAAAFRLTQKMAEAFQLTQRLAPQYELAQKLMEHVFPERKPITRSKRTSIPVPSPSTAQPDLPSPPRDSQAINNTPLLSSCHASTAKKKTGEVNQIQALIKQCAKNTDPILILGETGTGKSRLAKQIFEESRTAKKDFKKINCGDFTKGTAAAELFGHTKGAFTGADSVRVGIIRASAGGTLFLDEIGDLEPGCRAMLLTFLESGEVRPVGNDQPETVSAPIRVICATNKPESELIAERSDFVHRFKTIFRLPPLRNSKEQIPNLVKRFFNAISAADGGLRPYGHAELRGDPLRSARDVRPAPPGEEIFAHPFRH